MNYSHIPKNFVQVSEAVAQKALDALWSYRLEGWSDCHVAEDFRGEVVCVALKNGQHFLHPDLVPSKEDPK